jgi:hypothetical protein
MTTSPNFAATPRNASALSGTTIETNLQAPTQPITVFTAGASGSRIDEIRVNAVHTNLLPVTLAGMIYIFEYDGTNYNLIDTLPVTAITASTTVAPFQVVKPFNNLIIPSGHSIRCAISVAPTTGQFKYNIVGGDF